MKSDTLLVGTFKRVQSFLRPMYKRAQTVIRLGVKLPAPEEKPRLQHTRVGR
jgi:hypothetical protein